MLSVLVSAKGSPGVTTTAMALTAASTIEARSAARAAEPLLVELDPAGGDVELLTGAWGPPGMPRVGAGLRHGVDADKIRSRAVEVVPGVRAILSEAGGRAAESTLAACTDQVGPALAGLEELVWADAGRWAQSQRTARRLWGASLVVVVCHPTPAAVTHVESLLEELRNLLPAPLAVAVVGDKPYRVADVQAALPGVPVVGPIRWSREGVRALVTGGAGWRWQHSLLGRSAVDTLTALMARIPMGGSRGRVA